VPLYARTRARAVRQAGGDLVVLACAALAVRVGSLVHAEVLKVATPGRALEDVGRRLSASLGQVSSTLGGLPLVGGQVRGPLTDAAAATGSLVSVGQQQQAAAGRLALVLGLAVALLPIVLLALAWLPRRVRFVRTSSAAARVLRGLPDLDLLALRALVRQPVHVLAGRDPVSAAGWRRGDPDVVRALADLELADLGLASSALSRTS
jgi:hypothetical protein